MKLRKFLKAWALPLSMLLGVVAYFLFRALPVSGEVRHVTYDVVSHYVQPALIFCMLLLSFIRVRLHDMRPHRWQLWVLLVQAALFVGCSLLALHCPDEGLKVLCEGAMLAFICPTATAAAVVTGKLGGSIPGTVTYLMMCNLMVSLVAPAFLPLVEPHAGMTFWSSFAMILAKVFPLLICPLLSALLIRRYWPSMLRRLLSYPDLAFQLWIVALALAIAVTVRSIVHSTVGWHYMVGLAVISGVCCLVQFWLGKQIGGRYDQTAASEPGASLRITAGQALGQKNTVFIIWMGLVFLNPVTSIVGGFYSVWHNTVNSYQLYKKSKGAA